MVGVKQSAIKDPLLFFLEQPLANFHSPDQGRLHMKFYTSVYTTKMSVKMPIDTVCESVNAFYLIWLKRIQVLVFIRCRNPKINALFEVSLS